MDHFEIAGDNGTSIDPPTRQDPIDALNRVKISMSSGFMASTEVTVPLPEEKTIYGGKKRSSEDGASD